MYIHASYGVQVATYSLSLALYDHVHRYTKDKQEEEAASKLTKLIR